MDLSSRTSRTLCTVPISDTADGRVVRALPHRRGRRVARPGSARVAFAHRDGLTRVRRD